MARHDGVKVLVLVSLLLILDHAGVCLCRNISSSSICFEEERHALLQLKQSLSDTSHLLSSWNGEDCCRWTGVKCDRANGHVVMLQIISGTEFLSQQAFSTASELNSSLLNLRYLNYLDLSGIFFKNANILKSIGSMKQLRYLNLSNSFDFATISHEWGNLIELEVLDLHCDYYMGVVEDVRWVSQLQALKYLDMSGLDITGSREPMQAIITLPSLSHLSLSGCGLLEFHLSSDCLGNFTSLHLQYLDLSWNFFRDTIPSTIFQNMTSLWHLGLSGSFSESPILSTIFQNMNFLRHLDLSYNFFESSILSTIFQNITSLQHLDLSWSTLGGSIPSTIFQNMTSLRHLDLSSNLFEGPIPSTIFQNMISLRHLDLSKSTLRGSIPSTIFQNMTSLRHLDLSGSFSKSPIPSTIFQNMNFLQYLDLSSNLFEGPIPSTIFQNMTSLRDLDLSWNFFNSSVPRWSDNLRSLVHLNFEGNHLQSIEGGLFSFLRNKPFLESLLLGNNEIHEEIFSVEGNSSGLIGKNLERLEINNNSLGEALPDWLGHLKKLTVLDLSHNQLIGDIPEAIGRLQALWILDLSSNLLNGTLPHSLGQLQYLDSLDVSANSLRGTLSEINFSNLSMLSFLDISNNYLDFQVDSDWIPPFNLWNIRLVSCEFGTEFPQWIRMQVNAREIALSNASIRGALPDWLGPMSFSYLDLSYNQINGFLPKFPSDLRMLDLSHNLISGPIPQDIGIAMPNLSSLYLNDNLLSGPMPTSLCEVELLEELHLGRNELIGKIPACWKKPYMGLLDLSSNKLSGVIPSSLGNLIRLRSIHLNNNSLHGEIPATMSYCRSLQILDLGENKISGSVPHWFGPRFRFLQILRLRGNMFNGSIPSQLCSLSALQILDLAVNNLTGIIPSCLGYMKGMKLQKNIDEGDSLSPEPAPSVNESTTYSIAPTDWNQEHVEQVVKGIDLDYTTLDLQLMVNLDLSSNKLVGPIPIKLTLLSGLRGLNLSRNFLFGGIPAMIGDMKSLESLDLSNNHLSGTIPQSFSAFTSLSKLNLSHNNFMGPIPKGSQIQTLDDPSIYADNPLLCGDPLQKKCPDAEAPQVPKEDTDKQGKLEKVMFYIIIMLGFATGFWGVIGGLVFKKNWRHVYFNYVDRKTDMVYVIVVVKAAELRRRLRRA